MRRVATNAPAARVLTTPKRKIAAALGLTLLFAAVVFYGVDSVLNYGVVHAGVRVGDVQVAGLEQAEAETAISTGLQAAVNETPVMVYASDETSESWTVTAASLDTQIDADMLAGEAYGVGRGLDFIPGRLAATLFGVEIKPRMDFSSEKLEHIMTLISESTDAPMRNARVSFNGTRFLAHDGQDGLAVDGERFRNQLQEAFCSDDRTVIAPLREQQMQVDLADAEQAAEHMQRAVEKPVVITYGDISWTITSNQLGQLVTASAKEVDGEWQLVPQVDAGQLETVLTEKEGPLAPILAPTNASFAEVNGELRIVPGQPGTGADYTRLAKDLETLLFGAENGGAAEPGQDARHLQIHDGDVEPAFTESDAAAYEFSEVISTFTINYPGISEGSRTNIHAASDLINASIIAPQSVWSLTGTIGDYTEERGFVLGQVIAGDGYELGMGGGVCNVASTVYNTVYEAGYPIVEREFHTLRSERYPDGRDAVIAYPVHDLKFENDTDNYVLLTMSYTEESVTCTLWGVPPGYVVECISGELIEGAPYRTIEIFDETLAPGERVVDQPGMNASQIDVTRIVYYADGTLKEERTFHSSYGSTAEVVRVGPAA